MQCESEILWQRLGGVVVHYNIHIDLVIIWLMDISLRISILDDKESHNNKK
jgi:hypothetical protein